MTDKECYKCNVLKPLSCYYKNNNTRDGRAGKCKDCTKIDNTLNFYSKREYYREYDKRRQRLSINRILNTKYTQMKRRSKGLSNRKYKVNGMDIMSKQQFINWCNSPEQMLIFNDLYHRWRKSGYKRKFAPSIDRINSNIGYTIGNIQWLTVSDNIRKYYNAEITEICRGV